MVDRGTYNIELPFTDLEKNVHFYFHHFEQEDTLKHSIEVAKEAAIIAGQYGEDAKKAYISGLLHDISAVIPNNQRLELHNSLGLTVLVEEKEFPMLLHQKQSRLIAETLFSVTDEAVLSAIECHTTLKEKATSSDKVLFVADKVKWDRAYRAPYLDQLMLQLEESLDAAALTYLNWLFEDDLQVAHPWAVAAREELQGKHLDI